jgi:hypothetical protein
METKINDKDSSAETICAVLVMKNRTRTSRDIRGEFEISKKKKSEKKKGSAHCRVDRLPLARRFAVGVAHTVPTAPRGNLQQKGWVRVVRAFVWTFRGRMVHVDQPECMGTNEKNHMHGRSGWVCRTIVSLLVMEIVTPASRTIRIRENKGQKRAHSMASEHRTTRPMDCVRR